MTPAGRMGAVPAMAEAPHILFCALAATLLWTAIGLAPALLLERGVRIALAVAPAFGWAVHNAVALPLLTFFGFSAANTALLAAALAGGSLLMARRLTGGGEEKPNIPGAAFVGAALLAGIVAAAILPKPSGDAVFLSAPIFDHTKIAIVDAIVRQGLPPTNPVFAEAGGSAPFAYYYLWHFSAAQLGLLFGVSGWEADAAQTLFTAFAALALVMGLAVRLGGRPAAAYFVLALVFTGSLRAVFGGFAGDSALPPFLSSYRGLSGLFYQAAWAPQHVAGASCVLLSLLLIVRISERVSMSGAMLLGIVAAAGAQSSTWVGGVTFAILAPSAGVLLLLRMERGRAAFAAAAVAAAALAILFAFPMLRAQLAETAMRGGATFVLRPYPVLGTLFPEGPRRLLDLPAYWLVLLPIEFPAVLSIGLAGAVALLRRRSDGLDRPLAGVLALAGLASFSVAWLLASAVGENNDLGWRAVLPGLMILAAFGAAALAQWLQAGRRVPLALAGVAWLLALPGALQTAAEDLRGFRTDAGVRFAEAVDIWEAVRAHAGPEDRVGNNPLFLADLTAWPINISWALLSDRPSCFAGREMALAFAPLPAERREAINAQFIRVFSGDARQADVSDMAQRYGCTVVLLTPEDGAWTRDPFATSELYEKVSDTPHWRLYRVIRARRTS